MTTVAPIALSGPACIWDAGAVLGEGPVWDARRNALYWVDIKALAIHRCDASGGDRASWTLDEEIGCLIPDADSDGFIAGVRNGFARIVLPEGANAAKLTVITDPEADLPGNRFNDGKRAPDGSIWAGTMDDAEQAAAGSWWRLDPSGTVSRLDSGYMVTNGPAFDKARSRVYLTDSARRTIFAADLESAGAGFCNKRVFLRFQEGDGYPDGMTVDEEGALWVAFWDGACLRRFDAHGDLVQTVDMPVRRPTSLCFAGDGAAVFVTSASIGLPSSGPDGGLYRFDVWRDGGL